MASKVVNLRDRLNKRWANQQRQQQQIRKYVSCGKVSVLCKCPKCEVEHRLLIDWSGRGMPRVYCSTCRSMISSMGDSTVSGAGSLAARSARKVTYGYE